MTAGSGSRGTPRAPDQDGRRTLPAGLAVFNGFGKMVGATQIHELGCLETPVLLTATLSVFRVAHALLSYLHERPGRRRRGWATSFPTRILM